MRARVQAATWKSWFHKADLIKDAWLAREAVSAPNHPHDLETLDRGRRSLDGLEASCRLYDLLQRPMVCLALLH